MPATTRFIDGTGPVVAGSLFPFLFITIACGAVSGFHALISSGTTPKLVRCESDVRLIGYGAMLTVSLVGLMSLIAAATLDPGVYFAINTPLATLGGDAVHAAETIRQWGFTVTPEQMAALRRLVDEPAFRQLAARYAPGRPLADGHRYRIRLRAGERVLVHSAAGAVGCMAMQIARDAGCQAVGLCGGPDKAAWLRAFGCDDVVDYLRADWPQQALQLTAGRGFDVILDGNGGPNAVHNIDLAARLGRIVYIGATAGADPAPIPVANLILKSIAVAGMSLRQVEEPPGSAADQEIVAEILSGRWKLPISEVVPLAAVADLHRRLEARQLRGRAVIEVGGEL
jgi:hypothetical protein